MKSILLASTALVAFAGAAAADGHASIATNLSTTLGYNDFDGGDEYGFYWEGNLQTTASAALDNGVTAGAYFEITVATDDAVPANDFGQPLESSDFVISLESESAGLYFGDTGMAADQHWTAAGDMESDNFSTGSDSAVLRGDVSFGGVSTSISVVAVDGTTDYEQLSFGASGEFGAFTAAIAYQEEVDATTNTNGDFSDAEVFGLSVGGTFAGATVTGAYAQNSTADSTSLGVQVAYPFGPVTATAYFVAEEGTDLPDEDPNYGLTLAYSDGPISATLDYDNDQGLSIWELSGFYDLGNGLVLGAGYAGDDSEDENQSYFVSADYDLGGGAALLISYAEDDTGGAGDEIGPNDLQEGATVELAFEF